MGKAVTLTQVMFSVVRIAQIFPHWRKGDTIQEHIFYILLCSTTVIALSLYDAIEREVKGFSFQQTNILRLANIRRVHVPSLKHPPSIKEAMVYLACFA